MMMSKWNFTKPKFYLTVGKFTVDNIRFVGKHSNAPERVVQCVLTDAVRIAVLWRKQNNNNNNLFLLCKLMNSISYLNTYHNDKIIIQSSSFTLPVAKQLCKMISCL